MPESTLYVVAANSLVRESILAALACSYDVEVFESCSSLLGRNAPLGHGCLVLEVPLPHTTFLELRQELLDRGASHPFIAVVGHGDVPSAIEALRQGVIDVLEMPISRDKLLDTVRLCLASDRMSENCVCPLQFIKTLTPREKEVMKEFLTGVHSKKVARRLGISVNTVHVHRSHILKKMHVASVAELISQFK
jgi:two-component system response regulator FixJ